jgi:hypothetical protein
VQNLVIAVLVAHRQQIVHIHPWTITSNARATARTIIGNAATSTDVRLMKVRRLPQLHRRNLPRLVLQLS